MLTGFDTENGWDNRDGCRMDAGCTKDDSVGSTLTSKGQDVGCSCGSGPGMVDGAHDKDKGDPDGSSESCTTGATVGTSDPISGTKIGLSEPISGSAEGASVNRTEKGNPVEVGY